MAGRMRTYDVLAVAEGRGRAEPTANAREISNHRNVRDRTAD